MARIISSGSVYNYFADYANFIDILVVIPYYIDIVRANFYDIPMMEMNFAILTSSPEPIIWVIFRTLKILRLFKLSRHFKESRVLVETAANAWRQILVVISLLIFIVFVFAVMLYEVESGTPCYAGTRNCKINPEILLQFREGNRVVLDKAGDVSNFPNVFMCIWFSFVTVTTVGYGDIVPVSSAGQIMAVFLMLAGSLYMSIPLTVAGNIYLETHEKYMSSAEIHESLHRKEVAMQLEAAKSAIEETLNANSNGSSSANVTVTNTSATINSSLEAVDSLYELSYHQSYVCKNLQKKLSLLRGRLHTGMYDLCMTCVCTVYDLCISLSSLLLPLVGHSIIVMSQLSVPLTNPFFTSPNSITLTFH